jgi:hypothetical protein
MIGLYLELLASSEELRNVEVSLGIKVTIIDGYKVLVGI